jgi:thioredoxin reductase (NADPH)
VEALLIPSENLRALMIQEPELGERIMRAPILRRVALVETGAGGPVLIGAESSPDVIRLQGFPARNAYPHQLLDPTHRIAMRRSWSNNMPRIPRTCRWPCVRKARS